MAKYVVGVDVGTTGSKAMVIDLKGNVLGKGYCEYKMEYPKPDWVEVSASHLMELTFGVVKDAVENSKVDPADIEAVSFSLNRSSFCLMDENLDVIDDKFIVWLDARAESVMAEMAEKLDPDRKSDITGMPNGNIFAIAKLYWVMKNEPEKYAKTKYFSPVNSLVMHRFGADEFVCEVSDSTAAGLIDVETRGWCQEVIDKLGFDAAKFPPLVNPCTVVGTVKEDVAAKTGLPVGCKIVSGSGDQQVSAMGAGVIHDGSVSLTIGTFGLLAIGMAKPEFPKYRGMMIPLTPNGVFQLEGPQVSGATCYRWCRDVLCEEDIKEAEEKGIDAFQLMGDKYVKQSVPGCNGVMFYSALFGSGFPTWDTEATGMFLGLRSTTTKADIVRSVMEGITLETRVILDEVLASGVEMEDIITITGGASKSPEWCQIVADIFNRKIRTLNVPDSAVIGAAGIAAVGAGLYPNLEEVVDNMVQFGHVYEPNAENHEVYNRMLDVYKSAYKGLKENDVFAKLATFRQ